MNPINRYSKPESLKLEIGNIYTNRLNENIRILSETEEGYFLGDDGSLYTQGGLCSITKDSPSCKCLLSRVTDTKHSLTMDYPTNQELVSKTALKQKIETSNNPKPVTLESSIDLTDIISSKKMIEITKLLRKIDDLSKETNIKFTAHFG